MDQRRNLLVQVGSTVSARRVIDQARYTLGLVSMDSAVKEDVGEDFVKSAQEALTHLETALGERFVVKAHSKEMTTEQNSTLKAARAYRRSLVKRLTHARWEGAPIPDDAFHRASSLLKPGSLST
jgi:hypothetical protein